MALEHETKADQKAKFASIKPHLIFFLVLFALIVCSGGFNRSGNRFVEFLSVPIRRKPGNF